MSNSNDLAIDINGLCKAYARTTVLRNLEVKLRWGQSMTVLGPNGSGKTTLIRILAGLIRADAGQVRIAGLDIARQAVEVRRHIGVVTHETLLYADLTGHENLAFFGRMFNIDSIDDRITEIANLLGLKDHLNQRVGTLSHGFQKRFSIARALLHNPPLLVMDEPESGLDLEALSLLDSAWDKSVSPARSILMTTHNLNRGIAFGDNIAIIHNGKITLSHSGGSPADYTAIKEDYFNIVGMKE